MLSAGTTTEDFFFFFEDGNDFFKEPGVSVEQSTYPLTLLNEKEVSTMSNSWHLILARPFRGWYYFEQHITL
jgi:hypothetical protein